MPVVVGLKTLHSDVARYTSTSHCFHRTKAIVYFIYCDATRKSLSRLSPSTALSELRWAMELRFGSAAMSEVKIALLEWSVKLSK